jgi:hypothetical protein
MKVTILIFETRITCVVVPLESTKILLNIFVIIVKDSMHEGRW